MLLIYLCVVILIITIVLYACDSVYHYTMYFTYLNNVRKYIHENMDDYCTEIPCTNPFDMFDGIHELILIETDDCIYSPEPYSKRTYIPRDKVSPVIINDYIFLPDTEEEYHIMQYLIRNYHHAY